MSTVNTTGKEALVCDQVWKIYRSGEDIVRAVRDISVRVNDGELLLVRGPSGCGKSTLLNLLGGLDLPTKGEITVFGVRYQALNPFELSRFRKQNVGFVFQELSLIGHLTAVENVELPQMFDGIDRKSLRATAMELLAKVSVEHRATHTPKGLSFGERQRVAIARAIMGTPRLLLVDEPTANLDTANAHKIIDIFGKLRNQGTTIVMATHDERFETRADRVIHLLDGALNPVKP